MKLFMLLFCSPLYMWKWRKWLYVQEKCFFYVRSYSPNSKNYVAWILSHIPTKKDVFFPFTDLALFNLLLG